MKKFWTVFLSVLCAACLIGALVACKNTPKPPVPNGIEYSVTVKSLGGASLKNVTVNFYDGVDRVENGTATTDATGKATVRLEAGEYEVKLSNLPNGYIAPEKNQTTDKNGTAITYFLESKVIQNNAPTGYQYALGDVMYDFKVTTSEGKTFQLSKVLEEKKMVLINFWATWCSNCIAEFPYMKEAYASTYTDKNGEQKAYKDDVAVVALSKDDTNAEILNYQTKNNLTNTFDFASNSSMFTYFNVSAIPVSVIVDRYGVYSFYHLGSMASKEDFTNLFSGYISDDYVQIDHNDKDPDPGATIEYPKVTVNPVASEVIEEAINGTNVNGEKFNGTYHVDETSKDKEFSWPWIVGEDEEGKYLYNSNTGVQKYSFATVIISYHAQKDDILAFDYDISIEAPSDNSLTGDPLYVIYNGSQSIIYTGNLKGTCYVSVALEEGDYEVTLLYKTDYANDASFRYKDIIKIRNVRLADEAEMIEKGESRDMLLDCTTGWNADKNGWDNYVNTALNPEDGYYHLYNEETGYGPIVMLNTQYESHWSNTPIATYAVEALDEKSTNPYKDKWQVVMDYCGYASFSAYTNYVPVTKELHDALVFLVAHIEADHETYPNEWLELCVYFEHFGAGSAVADPIKGVAPFKAYTLHETSEEYTKDNYSDGISNGDLNEIAIRQSILPRGFFYEFSPAEDAVYEFKTFGEYATVCWIYDRETFSSDRDSIPQLNRETESNGNFTVYVPMYKGKTYFVMLDMGEQNVFGTYYLSVKNVGAEKTVIESITAGYYTTDFNSTDSIAARIVSYVEYGGIIDGVPKVKDANEDTFPIYVDLLSATNLTGNISLAQIFDPAPTKVVEMDMNSPVYELKTDANGEFMFDEFDNPIYDTSKPVYEFLRDNDGMPVYGADGEPVYDTSKPLYNYRYEIKKDDNGDDMYNDDGNPIYDYTKPVYKMNGGEYVYETQFAKSYVYDANGNTLITKGGVYVTQELNYTQSEDYEYLKGLIAEAKNRDENDPLYGKVQVTQRLQKILVDLVHRISDMRAGYVADPVNDAPKYVVDEWLMMCYYEHTYRIKVD